MKKFKWEKCDILPSSPQFLETDLFVLSQAQEPRLPAKPHSVRLHDGVLGEQGDGYPIRRRLRRRQGRGDAREHLLERDVRLPPSFPPSFRSC